MSLRHVLALVLAVSTSGVARAQAPDLNVITAVEVSDEGGSVVLSVRGSKPPNFTTFSMADPPRFVLDLSEARFQNVPEDMPVNDGTILVVKNLSYGSDATSISRVMIAFSVDVEPPDVQTAGNTLVVRIAKPAAGGAIAQQQDDAARRAAEEAEAQAKADAERRAQEEAQARAAAEAEAAAQAEAQAKADAEEAQRRAQEEREAQARAEVEAELRAEMERVAKEQAQAQAQADAEAQARAQAEAQAQAAAEADREAQEEAQAAAAAQPDPEAERQAAEAAREEELRRAKEQYARERQEAVAAAAAEAERKKLEEQERRESEQHVRDEARLAKEEEQRQKAEEARLAKEAEKQRLEEERLARAAAREEAQRAREAEAQLAASSPAAQLRELGFRQMPGVSRVFVRTSVTPQFTIQDVGDDTIRVELQNTKVARRNDTRFLDTSFFPTAVAMITPSKRGSTYVVDIKLKQRVPYQQRVEGDMLAIDFERPGAAAAEPPAPVATPSAEETDAAAPAEDGPADEAAN